MKQSRHRIAIIASLASIVLVPLFYLSSPLKPWSGSFAFVQNIVYPFEYAWHATGDYLSQKWNTYVALSEAAVENQTLRKELATIKTRSIDFEEQALEVKRLRALLGFKQRYERELLVAEVVGSTFQMPFYSIRLGRGNFDGVKVGMPLVTDKGIVGRIIRVGFKHSDAQVLTDSNFYVDVLLQRTRVRGVLRGATRSTTSLDLHRRSEVKIGDTIITSGIVGAFPKGLPVGKVKKISYASDNVSQSIIVEPWVKVQTLEEVFILLTKDRDTQKIIETAGKEWLETSLTSSGG